ncbi:MAG: DNA-directed RNA polymerase, partial [Candidatus Woesebacteria bacterium GW2011_GWA1_41_7]
PNKEMVLGCYYLTTLDISSDTKDEKDLYAYSDENELVFAYQSGKVGLRSSVRLHVGGAWIITSVGRVLFNEALPSELRFFNTPVKAATIKSIITRALGMYTKEEVVATIDAIKNIGFMGATLCGGLSVSVFDCVMVEEKQTIVKEAEEKVKEVDQNYQQGLITLEEKKRLSNEIWIEVTERIADVTWSRMKRDNPVKMIIDSGGARASKDQLKQLSAIKGLVVDPLGKIVELPTKSNYREGLSIFEYVTSTRGSRKGLTDTAIKTADAGYLTRRLVDVAHDLIVRLDDCGTKDGQEIRKDLRPQSFASRIFGRFAAKDIVGKDGKTVIIPSGEMIDQEAAKKIDESGIISISVRSPLTCQARHGICAKCYGWDLGTKSLVEIGMPVGVVAAQSIGEPGTQLTLRTKHAAGVVGVDVTQGLPRVEELVEARLPKVVSALSEITGKARISETDEGWKVTITSKGTPKEEKEYIIPKTLELAIEDGELVDAGRALAKGALDIKDILSIKGLRPAQEYIVNEIQKVYESQGIPINDKHVEVIVRKMSDEVRIVTTGDTPFLPGELTSRANFDEENEKVLAAGGEPASAQQVVLGITRRALYTDSWLSAASFEQTTDVLTEASLLKKNSQKDQNNGFKKVV